MAWVVVVAGNRRSRRSRRSRVGAPNTGSFSSATTTVNVAKTGSSRSASIYVPPTLFEAFVFSSTCAIIQWSMRQQCVTFCYILQDIVIDLSHDSAATLHSARFDRGHELVKALPPSRFVIIKFETTMYTWMYHVPRTYSGGLQDVLLFVIGYLLPQASNFYIHGKVIAIQWLERRN